jgi:hypothetical protein
MIFINQGDLRTWLTPPAHDSYLRPPALLSVAIDEGEQVVWHWTHLADGHSVVTGYSILRRVNTPGAAK